MNTRPEPKTFTSAKLDLLDAMSMDPRVTDGEFRTAYRLAQHANSETGAMFPSQERLADQMGTKARAVRQRIAGLVEKGWLLIWRPNKRAPNSYRFDGRHVNAILDRQAMLNEARREDKAKAIPGSFDRHEKTSQNLLTGTKRPLVTGTKRPPNTLREHLKDIHLKEGEEALKVSSASPSYGEEDDPHQPYPVPTSGEEAIAMLGQMRTAANLSPAVLTFFRKKLFAGELTPAMVEEQRRLAS